MSQGDKERSITRSKPPKLPTVALFDIDGTLVSSRGTVSEKVREALLMLDSLGVRKGFATGRPSFACKDLARELGINSYSSFFAGAAIIDPLSWKVVTSWDVSGASLVALLSDLRKHHFYTELYTTDEYFAPFLGEHAEMHRAYIGRTPVVADIVELSQTRSFVKGVVCLRKEERPAFEALIQGHPDFSYGFAFGASHPDWIFCNITNREANRERVFQELLTLLEVSANSVMAIGDGEQDIPFISAAGFGVAMGNAPDGVRAAARFTASSVERDGIAPFIYELFEISST